MIAAVRIALVVAALVLAGSIVWAVPRADFFAAFGEVAANPWGLVSLIDLYVGFVAAAVLIVVLEPNRPLAIGLAVILFVLGNVVTALWLAWRLPVVLARLGRG